jgi:hypothetical protein
MPQVIGPVNARWSNVGSTRTPRFAMTKSGNLRRLTESAIAGVWHWGTARPVVGRWRHGQLMRMVRERTHAGRYVFDLLSAGE